MVTPGGLAALSDERNIAVELDPRGAIRVSLGDLDRLIGLAKELNLVVLGLDGFEQDEEGVYPMIEYIADFSSLAGAWGDRVTASAKAGCDVAIEWAGGPDIAEVVLDGLDE